jgi:transglutaminase-like putative cysteine protease
MNEAPLGIDLYLHPTYFVDSDHPDVIDYAWEVVGEERDQVKMAVLLYEAVRDDFRYYPYNISLAHVEMKASTLINRTSKSGYCIEKACLYNAVLRVVGIPSRFRFFNVRNHIGVERFVDIIKTDVLAFHSCSEVFLNGKWLKATPAFNKELCEKTGVDVLAFNGHEDSIFQEYSTDGSAFMEYLKDYGTFHDVPHDMFVAVMKEYYPHFFEQRQDYCMVL